MAYFPNGTSGMHFMETFCFRCIHWKDLNDGRGEGCPIMDLHMLWNYDAVGQNADDTKKTALDMLIPRTKEGINHMCSFFVSARSLAAVKANETRKVRNRDQVRLFEYPSAPKAS